MKVSKISLMLLLITDRIQPDMLIGNIFKNRNIQQFFCLPISSEKFIVTVLILILVVTQGICYFFDDYVWKLKCSTFNQYQVNPCTVMFYSDINQGKGSTKSMAQKV